MTAAVKGGYDRRYGETDLLEADAPRTGGVVFLAAAFTVSLLICGIALGFAGFNYLSNQSSQGPLPEPSVPVVPVSTDGLPASQETLPAGTLEASPQFVIATNTIRPTMALFTVTPAPPTATPTETPGPCRQMVQTGDDLISLAYSCGHRSLDVLPLILELNDLDAPERIFVGQELLIPWPTPTVDPNAQAPTQGATGGGFDSSSAALAAGAGPAEAAQPDQDGPTPEPTPFPTETLLPGVMWHIVQPNESMVGIAFQYNTNAEVLSQLNPEIAFSQCDFGEVTGGPRCTVLLGQGQQVRVPAPTPTATLSPTLSGSETPLPTATPTFNAPSALGPNDRALFLSSDLITLRWVTTGALSETDVYRVIVIDRTAGVTYQADTRELSYIIPTDWQGTDERLHEYEWTVSVIRLEDPDRPIFVTSPRTFSWESQEASE